jgi:hypothetical protein
MKKLQEEYGGAKPNDSASPTVSSIHDALICQSNGLTTQVIATGRPQKMM